MSWEGDGDLCMYSDMSSLLMQWILGYDALIWGIGEMDSAVGDLVGWI